MVGQKVAVGAQDCHLVVKGAHTMVCSSDGLCFFNSSGNPGMAKGGSGDVLTGFLAGQAVSFGVGAKIDVYVKINNLRTSTATPG